MADAGGWCRIVEFPGAGLAFGQWSDPVGIGDGEPTGRIAGSRCFPPDR